MEDGKKHGIISVKMCVCVCVCIMTDPSVGSVGA